ncbi:exonuclease SbcCD subunit D [Massilibacteroides sp.]|uniref:exonuclease SbcCD subunit D n=1 Tax=Massilibacteroides sp. TaxID=2034766 RepID=UPI00260BCBB8|nr:exonuclease SbcCD subunit D [Massilibacteroides sp.]MDD4515506.1 exonuclease SbcCD subunit D C-terminal domain-containing protein [Massilibacteroides sp.]
MALRILHTADWHLGQTFFGFDREDEHDFFLNWLTYKLKEQQADILLIAGDVFDVANPSATAQHHFFRFLKEVNSLCPNLQIIIIAGNHDSAARLEAPSPLLEELNTTIFGFVRRTENGEIDYDSLICPLYNKDGEREGLCLCVPYLRQGDYPPAENDEEGSFTAGVSRLYRKLTERAKKQLKADEALVSMGHLHATGSELSENDRSERVIIGGLESIPADAFDRDIVYTALGHIHKAQRVGGRDNVRYSGSPLPMSFSETRYKHQVVSIRIEKGKTVEIESIPIPLSVELLTIPSSPQLPDAVIEALKELPDKADSANNTLPYVEVRVLLTEPDPGFRHRVEEVIKEKAVRLTSIITSYPKGSESDKISPLSYEEFQQISPLAMLEHAFSAKYGNELPEEIRSLFNDVVREVEP